MAGVRAAAALLCPLLCLLLLLPARPAAAAPEEEEEDGVLVLRAASFEQALAQHRYLLVEFCERAGSGPGRAGGGCGGRGCDREHRGVPGGCGGC